MLQVVNGFVCMSGCDVAAARRGADPRNPTKDPVKQALLDQADPMKATRRTGNEAVPGLGAVVDILV